jgi:hypothetical protein
MGEKGIEPGGSTGSIGSFRGASSGILSGALPPLVGEPQTSGAEPAPPPPPADEGPSTGEKVADFVEGTLDPLGIRKLF